MQTVDRLGKYEVVRHLASGGMARVYLARVSGVGGFERHVVLKTVRPERTDDQSYVTMFLDEARLVATLHHQHIAQVHDIGVADDGTYFLAMEYLHGETLRSILEQAGARGYRLPLEFALTCVCAAASGLHHAHTRRRSDGAPLGIVHRDVSPSNVIVGYDGSIKLIDFGIAKAEARSTKTMTGFVKGKAGYMAPEQALGHRVDRRSDIFALGVLLYELTTQQRAFRAPSEFEAVQRIIQGTVTPPTRVLPGYPPELEAVVMTALSVDPEDRFQDADAMRRAVELAASHLGIAVGGPSVGRVLGDLFGDRPEPWLVEPAEDDYTVVDSESAPILAMRAAPTGPIGVAKRPLSPRAAAAGLALQQVESDDVPTARIIHVEPEPPPLPVRVASGTTPPSTRAQRATLPLRAPSVPPRAPSVPPRAPSVPQLALGSTPPPPRGATPPLPVQVLPPTPPSPGPVTYPSIRMEPTLTSLRDPRRTTIIASIAAAVLGVGLVAMIAATGDEDIPSPPPAPKPTASTAAPEVLPDPAPPAPATVAEASPPVIALQVTTDPPGATVVLDGERLGKSPLTITMPATEHEGWLKVRKRGHLPRKIRVSLDDDVTWDVRLPPRR